MMPYDSCAGIEWRNTCSILPKAPGRSVHAAAVLATLDKSKSGRGAKPLRCAAALVTSCVLGRSCRASRRSLSNSLRCQCLVEDARGFAELANRYDGFLLDQYGVLHDGRELLPGVETCLSELRCRNKALAIVSNSPCESARAAVRLRNVGLAPEHFLCLVTSGDLARRHLDKLIARAAPAKPRCLFISHDDHVSRGTWSPSELQAMGLTLVSGVADADFVLANGVQVCFKGTDREMRSALEADANDWSVFGPVLQAAADAQLPLVVANPDTVIHRNDGTVSNCPGLLAREYQRLGGRGLHAFGKPGPEIFLHALETLQNSGAQRVCHVGDSLVHDVGGAAAAGLDSIFVCGGIHAVELQEASVSDLCMYKQLQNPTFSVPAFRW